MLELQGYRMGVRRLAITDPLADQPILHGAPGRGLSLVFNGSLAYPDRLRQGLAEQGLQPVTGNDAELVLLAYRAQGIAGLRLLEGPFAFAIADESRGELILGRDAFGEKPLFYSRGSDGSWPGFASTVLAMRILHAESGSRPSPEAVRSVASQGWTEWDGPELGLDLVEFPRGTIAVFARDRQPVFHELLAGPARRDAQTLSLETLIRRSVQGRVHGDRPLGLLLSGGLDSACLAMALRDLEHPALCLSLDLEGMVPESERAREVASHLGLAHRAFVAGPEILDDLEGLIQGLGVPLADSSLLATHRICREARKEGLGILLSGEGGDELFLGYRRQRAGPWLGLAQDLLPGPPRMILSRLAHGMSRRSWGAGLRLVHALGRQEASYSALWSLASPVDLEALFGTGGYEAGVATPAQVVAAFDGGREDVGDAAAETLVRQELDGYLAYDLCPKLDCASLAAGVEARAPLLDSRLLLRRRRQALGHFESQGKGEIRDILAQALPARLRGGPKRGFGIPLGPWLAAWPRARTILGETPGLPWSRAVALTMLEDLVHGRGLHRAPLLYHLLVLAIHIQARRQPA